jgi:hypothetical protein
LESKTCVCFHCAPDLNRQVFKQSIS